MAPRGAWRRRERTTALLLCAGLAAGTARAAPKVDLVVLGNGSRIVGEIRSMSRGRLEVRTDDMGTLQIEWGNVVEVTAPEFFEVEDMEGALYFGSLRPGQPGAVEVVADWGKNALLLGRVARIQLVRSGFWERWKGSIDAGAGYTSATELVQVDVDAELRYRRPGFEASAQANGVLTQQPEADETRRGSLTLAYARLLANRHRVFGQGILEKNQELGYDLRLSALGGWGYMLARSQRNELVAGAGLGLNHEVPLEGESTTNVEAVLGLDWANFAYDFPSTDIRVSTLVFVGLNQWGRVRLESSASLRREVFSDFFVGLKGYESYDSEPATQGAQRNDWGLSLTLGYSF